MRTNAEKCVQIKTKEDKEELSVCKTGYLCIVIKKISGHIIADKGPGR